MLSKIQLHKPSFNNREIQLVKKCIKSGWVSNQGKFVELFKQKIKKL